MTEISTDRKTRIKIITALYILKILQREQAHGNKIAEEIKCRTQQTISPNPNSLYPLLRKMEERGYVTSHWDNPDKRAKRIYAITQQGHDLIPELETKIRELIEDMKRKIAVLMNDLFL